MTQYKGESWDKVPSQEVFDEIFRVSKNQIIFGGNYFKLPPTRGIICWDKRQSAPNFSQWEMAWTSFDKPAKLYSSTFMFDKSHPTQKPLDLMEWIISNWTQEGDTILDPFMGSGTTLVAAHNTRNVTGIEISPEYVKIAQDRLSALSEPLF